jgi:ATP-dependent DNA helicase RecG
VTDEQHRFGIDQRAALEKKGNLTPDVLVMTATPIPRTMTLTVYGDLDVSLIRELPPGRQPIRTFLRQPDRRELIYQYVRTQIEAGRQAYVVCPLIEGSEDSDLPSAEEVYDELRYGIFYGIPCGLVHGRMKGADKEAVMEAFYENKVKLLVSTTVIEVGVNVPNASMMVIENADRFGLAQLHQLRGRIGRGQYKSYCILVSEGKTENARERLKIMENTSDGFELAEEDLRLRGPGQFFGHMQHGLPDLKIADVLGDMDILLQAWEAAAATLENREDMDFVLPVLAAQYREQFARITEL